MDITEAFVAAYERAGHSDGGRAELLPSRLTRACADVLPVSGAGMALFAGSIRVPLGASDPAAADAERLQFTTGEGPCIHAHITASTVQVDEAEMALRWPLFHAELLAKTRVRSIVAVPLGAPLTGLGTVDLFYRDPHDAFTADLGDVAAVVGRMATLLLDGVPLPTSAAPDLVPPHWLSRPMEWRSEVVVAVGMLNAALDLTSQEALDVLRGHAWATDSTLDDTAHDVVTRRLSAEDLSPAHDC
ncbi:ANTAR domain-containing protein [Nakamurella deserti]|uniref:ANTAR domain-containing protein n=1 Tax=Nakamurella deserti TaxID=2164074 RepID=UPI000DBE9D5B|nr:ANTAR domain-containing protein [Nakamurella deserti]